MELKEILAITGKSGLYRFVAQSRHGFVVEPLEGGARFAVPTISKVSTLSEIAMFMQDKDLPLADVFTTMLTREKEIEALDIVGNDVNAARALYEQLFPTYHRQKVRDKDIMKAFKWFLILVHAGMHSFKPATEEKADTAEQNETK
ncbi:MAG: DUF5606 family protein [Bacteroides sp.]